MYDLRPYQREAVEAVYRFLREKDTNPCVVIPTAGGKSLCIAQVAKDAVTLWGGRVLILAHVKELVEQNAAKLRSLCPNLKVGVYSAGLDSRDTEESVVVAGIQSVYNRMELFKPFDLIMVDEVHCVKPELAPDSEKQREGSSAAKNCEADRQAPREGRYRTFLNAAKAVNPRVRLIGWTATPFRTQGGLVCKPENLFNEICYEVGVKELIDKGYISRLTAKAGRAQANLEHLHIRAGEFIAEEVEKAMGADDVVRTACREIVERTRNRKTCLVFCTSVAHCRKVAALIAEFAHEECAIVTGDTPDAERAETIARLRGESVQTDLFGSAKPPLKYCCNVAVMTTGTDIPNIDTVALLRPTASAGLYVQMVGRGFRLSPATGKTECLVLDYGGNIERFGPVDMIDIRDPRRAEKGEPLVKICPQCRGYVRLPVMLCPECGYEFPRKEPERKEHEGHAANGGILSGEVSIDELAVKAVDYCVWEKRGAPPDAPKTVRVTYRIDMVNFVSEWLCPEHRGYARAKFERWWREHAPGCFMPNTAEDVCECFFAGMVRPVKIVKIRRESGKRYPEVIGYEFETNAECGVRNAELPDSSFSTPNSAFSIDSDFDDLPF